MNASFDFAPHPSLNNSTGVTEVARIIPPFSIFPHFFGRLAYLFWENRCKRETLQNCGSNIISVCFFSWLAGATLSPAKDFTEFQNLPANATQGECVYVTCPCTCRNKQISRYYIKKVLDSHFLVFELFFCTDFLGYFLNFFSLLTF